MAKDSNLQWPKLPFCLRENILYLLFFLSDNAIRVQTREFMIKYYCDKNCYLVHLFFPSFLTFNQIIKPVPFPCSPCFFAPLHCFPSHFLRQTGNFVLQFSLQSLWKSEEICALSIAKICVVLVPSNNLLCTSHAIQPNFFSKSSLFRGLQSSWRI